MTPPRPVRYYLKLRLLQAWRFFPAWDIHPVIGLLLAVALFGAALALAFSRTRYAPWLVALMPAGLFAALHTAETRRVLRLMLNLPVRRRCRLAEVAAILLPFLVVLLVKGAWWPAAGAVLLSAIAAWPEGGNLPQIPVLRSPFPAAAPEWHGAWRRFPVPFLLYGLSFIPAVALGNGAFAMLGFMPALYAVCAAYGEMEAPELLCAHRSGAGRFLRRKLLLALNGYARLLAPLVLVTPLAFRDSLAWLPLLTGAGALLLTGCLLLRYLFYPNAFAAQLSGGIFFGLTLAALVFPHLLPLQMLLCGYCYYRALRTLSRYLPC